MILGTGVDIIEIDRIQNSIEKLGEKFLKRIYTDSELEYCLSKKNKYQHFAARFAAKEAVAKALSPFWESHFNWKDIEVYNELSGQPKVKLNGKFKNKITPEHNLQITISHSRNYVVCFAILDMVS